MFTSGTLFKTVLRRSLFGVAFVGYVFAVAFTLRFTLKEPPTAHQITQVAAPAVSPVSKEEKKITPALPVRLKIPKINVDAAIGSTGLTSDGDMAIPQDPDGVAWYSLGPRPGDIGSAVLAGHYGWDKGRGSVFNNLRTLQKGDTLSVDDEKGVTATFVVRESKKYEPEADASGVFISKDGKSHLNIITCDGIWDAAKQTYTGRLIVFTDKEHDLGG